MTNEEIKKNWKIFSLLGCGL